MLIELSHWAEKYDNIYCTVGTHPHESNAEKVTVEKLVELSSHPKVIGLGETGLDFYYEHSPKDIQKDVFLTHITAAQETNLPLMIHTRLADSETIDILKRTYQEKPFKAIIHCFSSSEELAKVSMDLGFYISISGIVTFKKADQLRKIIKNLPLENLLVETDAPFLAPDPHRGKRNEPAFVVHVAEKIAQIKDIPVKEVGRQTTENFCNLFSVSF